ncbi:shikimate dehydrogenase family protein [Pseudooceanicola aestuarii]|uniref:shikimate dehydrogenase family protein n=1 Tax=Pseudooceanicola aestuarii TaxID=2697319 RepID=UPI0013D0BF3D|nr:ThiF family adenylyltransferase [Pseudooceanicola aestuarii]
MSAPLLIPNLSGAARIYAVWGDPVAQVQTPRLINPLFAAADAGIWAVPFHVTPGGFDAAWDVFRAIDNVAGIGVTVPHKVAAARRCDTLSDEARAVGAVNSIQRGADGRMHGALFDGRGFVLGLGVGQARLAGARVLMVGAGGAGRAIAHALAGEGIAMLGLMDPDPAAVAFTAEMVAQATGRPLAQAEDGARGYDGYDVIINASPIGMKGDAVFPVPPGALRPDMLIADIAALEGDTALLRAARAAGARVSDGNDMLQAQIALIAGFATGQPAGRPMMTGQG